MTGCRAFPRTRPLSRTLLASWKKLL